MDATAVEAEKQLSSLLDRVAQGERITITRSGVPAALLVPIAPPTAPQDYQEIIRGLRELRQQIRPGEMSLREMIEEGRRY